MRQSEKRYAINDRFILKLNRRLEELRNEALATGAARLLPDGTSEWVDPEMREESERGMAAISED
ncbi:MAG: hypothetical protein ABIM50_09890 [Novosphingobium sp.]